MGIQHIKLDHSMLPAYGEMDLQVRRVLNCCLIGIDQSKSIEWDSKVREDRFHAVDIRRYGDLGGLKPWEAYNEIVEVLKMLKSKELVFPIGDNATYYTSLVHSFIAQTEPYIIFIELDKTLVPLISGYIPSGQFLLADPRMDKVNTARKYTFYLLIKKHLWKLEQQPSFLLTLVEVREVFKLEPEQYPENKHIVNKLIKPALKDIYSKIGVGLKVKSTKAGFEVSYAN